MFKKYLDYIKNTGSNPKISYFDEDWEPIGPQVRKEMEAAGLIYEKDGIIFITKGE